MNKLGAVSVLIREARSERVSTTAAKRIVKACRALDLTDEDIRSVMMRFEYCNISGEPWNKQIERVWP